MFTSGNADGGFGTYDHFPNENPFAIPDKQYTLRFECLNTTRFPTRSPTHSPSNAPTKTPSAAPTSSPSASPIATCNTLRLGYGGDANTTCDANNLPMSKSTIYIFLLQSEEYNNHSIWIRNQAQEYFRWPIYYSSKLDSWIIVWHDDESVGAVSANSDQAFVNKEAAGLETPPTDSVWQWHEDINLFEPTCSISLSIECQDSFRPSFQLFTGNPTPAPSSSPSEPPTRAPSSAPTESPTSSPSYSPTTSPTSAPTLLCGGLSVKIESNLSDPDYANYFDGSYRRQSDNDLR